MVVKSYWYLLLLKVNIYNYFNIKNSFVIQKKLEKSLIFLTHDVTDSLFDLYKSKQLPFKQQYNF